MANNLLVYRKMFKYSQKEIGEKLGMTASGYQKMEAGERTIKSEKLETLSQLYGVSIDKLLGEPSDKLVVSESDALKAMAQAFHLSRRDIAAVERFARSSKKTRKQIIDYVYATFGDGGK